MQASAIMSNPNTDPHTFEASASTGRLVNAARLVVQNGLGYDTFMDTIEKAVPDSGRRVIVVQKLLGLPDSTPNWPTPRSPRGKRLPAGGPVVTIPSTVISAVH